MSAKAKKHLFMNLFFIVGTIIGALIFGESKSYFMTLTGMIAGYWIYHNVWAGRENVPSTDSECNKHIVNNNEAVNHPDELILNKVLDDSLNSNYFGRESEVAVCSHCKNPITTKEIFYNTCLCCGRDVRAN